MSVPAGPDGYNNEPVRPQVNFGQVWAGGLATAVVAALIAVVGVLISRWLIHVPILAPSNKGAWGDANTAYYALAAAAIALAATALLNLLMLATSGPTVFLGWILGLATLAAAVYPFSTGAPVSQKAATAVVNLAIGVAIWSLLAGVAARGYYRSRPAPRRYAEDPRYEDAPTRQQPRQ
jgi:Family of unknown function (DUF6069)